MKESRTYNSIRNIMTGFVGQGISMIVSFVNRIVFVRVLSEAYLGVNGLFTNVLSVLSLAELGISSAITFALYKPLASKDNSKLASLMNFYAKSYRTIGMIVGISGLILMPFLKYIIADPGNITENLYVIYLLFLFNSTITYFYSYKSSLIIADQKNYLVSMISYSTLMIQTILQIAILVFTKNYYLYLICQTVSNLVTNILISRKADKEYPFLEEKNPEKLSKEDKKSLFVNIKALMIVKLSGVLVNSTDNIIITATKGLGLVTSGLASNYILLTSILSSILSQLFNGVTASVGNYNALESDDNKYKMFNIINVLNFWFYGWCTISFIVLGSDIVQLLFGSEYLLTKDIVIIMAVNFYTVGMQNAVWTYKNTMGLYNYGKYMVLCTGILNIVFSLVFVRFMGLFGIYLATFVSRLFTNLWYDPYAVFKHGLNQSFSKYLKKYVYYFIIIVLTTILLENICNFFNMAFIMKLLLCIIMPNLCFIICFIKTEELRYLLNRLLLIIGKL